jgi:predicted dehydrogenase
MWNDNAGRWIEMSSRTVGWGVLSTANIGRKAVNPAIQASSNGELVAVASREEGRARAFAEETGIPTAYGSYEALLEDDRIEAVYNPLPNSLHKEWTVRASEKGKHVLCEKPLALNAAECREMEAAASANGVKLMEAFMYRFHPRTEKVLETVRAGALGKLTQIRSSFTFLLTRDDNIRWDGALGGGALMDVGCYCVNVSRTMAGREPVEVRAMANFRSPGVDAQMAGSLRFDDGLLAHFDCALTMERTEVYHLMGTEGHLRVPNAFLPGTDEAVIERFDLENNLTTLPVPGADEYRLMVEHFADCVLNDRPVRFSAEEAALNMRVIEALYQSARKDGAEVMVR